MISPNRWIIALAGLLIEIAFGTIYAWYGLLDVRPAPTATNFVARRNVVMGQLRTFLGAAVAASGQEANRVFGRNQLFLRRVRWRRM
jgi:hypothetical protein